MVDRHNSTSERKSEYMGSVDDAIAYCREDVRLFRDIPWDVAMKLVEEIERLRRGGGNPFPPVAPGDFKTDLIERLKDPVYAAEYLVAAIDEMKHSDDLESLRLVIVAAKDVAAAHGGAK